MEGFEYILPPKLYESAKPTFRYTEKKHLSLSSLNLFKQEHTLILKLAQKYSNSYLVNYKYLLKMVRYNVFSGKRHLLSTVIQELHLINEIKAMAKLVFGPLIFTP